jgi:hypothetical protein
VPALALRKVTAPLVVAVPSSAPRLSAPPVFDGTGLRETYTTTSTACAASHRDDNCASTTTTSRRARAQPRSTAIAAT